MEECQDQHHVYQHTGERPRRNAENGFDFRQINLWALEPVEEDVA
jgi:hypothetical protein